MDPGSLPAPGDLLELSYMRTALSELVLLAIAGGILGSWIVLRRIAFFAHAAGTATFPGLVVAEGAGLGGAAPQLAALGVALGYAGGVERAGRRGGDPGDTATALGLVFALALGIVLASDVFSSGAAVDRLLFGTALGLGGADLAIAGAAAALAVLAALTLGRAWTAAAFDTDGAAALGLPRARTDAALLAVVAICSVAALPAVGALLVASLFVVPAAVARLFARSVPRLVAGAVAVALVQAAGGLYLSLWLDVPPGPAVALLGAALYGAAALSLLGRPAAAQGAA